MSLWCEVKDIVSGRRPICEALRTAVRGYRTVRVAVMGSKASGKTVFLTALANHLRDHRPDEFRLGGRTVTWDRQAIAGDSLHGLPFFRYEEARGLLAKGEWPRKTTEPSILAMRLLVEDRTGRQESVQLEVVDVPGERVADFAMKGRSYREWCRWMQTESASPAYRTYAGKIAAVGPDRIDAAICAYRDFIAEEYAAYAPCVTPSTVKLGLDGGKRGGDPAAFRAAIEKVPVGFTGADGTVHEFIPLPGECFAAGSPWSGAARRFGRAYDRYVREVVDPVVGWMSGADRLIYLVDVLTLLQSGAKACDSERQYGEASVAAVCPRAGGVLDRLGRWAAGLLWRSSVNAVYVVATKADCVWSQTNRDNMALLADSLLGRALKFLDRGRVRADILPCAAVCSTKERTDGRPGLQGALPDREHPGGHAAARSWTPSDVPSAFPASSDEWKAMIEGGCFNYQFAFPRFDEAQMCPPRHINLDILAELILSR